MTALNEVLLTTDGSGQLWNGCIWDYNTGTSLRLLKGGTAGRKTLTLIGTDRVISADILRPVLTCWSLNNKDQQQLKMVCPGRVTALTATADGLYCVGAIAEKLYIWQVSTGDLLTVIAQHFLTVTCLRISDDGGFLISAGDDCLVLVWKLGRILQTAMGSSTNDNRNDTPHYRWTNHSLAVTDVYIGMGGGRARVLTSSLDRTCSLYSLTNGEHLLTVIFEVSIHAVAMDITEAFIFAGGMTGQIFQVNLFDPPQTLECHFDSSKDNKSVFVGHGGPVSCLAVSMDSRILISGSNDLSVKIWSIPSRQCLRSLLHKGPVTNIVLFSDRNSIQSSGKSTQNIQPFRSYVIGSDNLEGTWTHSASITPHQRPNIGEDVFKLCQMEYQNGDKDKGQLQLELEELKELSAELFQQLEKKGIDQKKSD